MRRERRTDHQAAGGDRVGHEGFLRRGPRRQYRLLWGAADRGLTMRDNERSASMRVILVVLAFVAVASRPTSGQVAGDSVRLRIRPSSTWTHGRFVSLDSSQLFLSQADQNQSYPLQNVARFEVRRPKHR